MNKRTKNTILGIYDRMERIVEDELLVRGEYVREASENSCGRNRYCAIGSLFAAGRVSASAIEAYAPQRSFTAVKTRAEFLRDKPSLTLALVYLDRVAQKVIDRRQRVKNRKPSTVEWIGIGLWWLVGLLMIVVMLSS